MRTTVIFAVGVLAGAAIQSAIGQGQNRGIVRMNHVGINVPDIEAAATYYTETIGFKEAFRARDEAGNTRLVYLQVSRDSFVELNQAGDGRPVGLGHFGLHVEDVEAAAETFSNAGAEVAEVRQSSTGAVLSNVFDPNGVRMELAELPPESDHYKAMESWGR